MTSKDILEFVKDQSEVYDEEWLPVIARTHVKLLYIDPNYQILQIKEKFGGLRYYYSSEFSFGDPERDLMESIVTSAEDQIDEIERERHERRRNA